MQVPIPTRCYTCKFQNWPKLGLKYQNIMNWRPSKTRFNSTSGDFCRLQTVKTNIGLHIPYYICSAQSRNRYHSRMALRKVRIPTWLRKVGIFTDQSRCRMVSAQSRNMDQVRIVVILFYPLLGQRLNLVGCCFD